MKPLICTIVLWCVLGYVLFNWHKDIVNHKTPEDVKIQEYSRGFFAGLYAKPIDADDVKEQQIYFLGCTQLMYAKINGKPVQCVMAIYSSGRKEIKP